MSLPGMKAAVGVLEPLLVYVCIDLRGADVRMPEHLLDDPQVGAVAEQVCGEAMAEQVRMHPGRIETCELRTFLHDLPDAGGGQFSSIAIEEDEALRFRF